MPEPVTWVSIAVLASLGAGFGVGYSVKPNGAAKALEAQTAAIAALNEGNQALVAEVNAVSVLDAERELQISDKLTNVPPMCIPELGGDPMSSECIWAWCVRTGETDKQRCEAGKLTDVLIERMSCPDKP